MRLAIAFLLVLPLLAAPTVVTVTTAAGLQTAIDNAAAANTGPQIIVLAAGTNFDTATGFTLPARTGYTTLTGDCNPTASKTLTGSKTLFLTELASGNIIKVNSEVRTVYSIESNTSLTVTLPFTDTAGGAAIYRLYTGWITLRSSRVSELPAKTRVAPADAAKMATLRVSRGSANGGEYNPALYTIGHPTSYWRIEGLEVTLSTTGLNNYGALIGLGFNYIDQDEVEDALVSHHFVIDRCYVHGIAFDNGPKEGILANADNVEILNSYVSEIKHDNSARESHAILAYSLNGPLLVRNTFHGGAAIGSLIGGTNLPGNGRTDGATIHPNHLQFLGNHYQKTPTHRALRYAGDPQGTTLPTGGVGHQSFWKTDTSVFYIRDGNNGGWRPVATGITGNVCVDGDFWNNTTAGTYFLCTKGAWASTGANRTIAGGTFGTFGSFMTKNAFELKNSDGALVEGNLIENCYWPMYDGQACAAFLLNFYPSQSGTTTSIREVTIRNNLIRGMGTFYSQGGDLTGYSAFSHRAPGNIRLDNNLFENASDIRFMVSNNKHNYYWTGTTITTQWGQFLSLQPRSALYWRNERFAHNTAISPFTNSVFYVADQIYSEFAAGAIGFRVDDNLIETSEGWTTLRVTTATPGYGCSAYAGWTGTLFRKNLMVNFVDHTTPTNNYSTPDCLTWAWPHNRSGTGATDVGYTDWAAKNFRLSGSSYYKGWASDGSDPGANQDTVEWATAGAASGADNPYLDFRVRAVAPTAGGAVLNFTAYSSAACTWVISNDRSFTSPLGSISQTRTGRDGVATITGLSSDTGYWYRVTCDGTARDGEFVTTH
jgi:hypothetical protein